MITKTILFIGHLWPEPNSSAAGYRTMALINAMVNDKTEQDEPYWQLHFACAAEKTEFCTNLDEQSGIISHQIMLNDTTFDELINELTPDFFFMIALLLKNNLLPECMSIVPMPLIFSIPRIYIFYAEHGKKH
ncbi:MAG: hypothetical protein KZQ64_07195 [gamma proteobacterium symbiont of Bathyaustriella thionipta]|nr:hypothetical protein [gamma proteobacterium symbiont of Bathyaustriella thionipta]MCU7950792.1 hypothetical protein [gamma proteobacterium symbiont of Bathyaustriella thionipta]MCU7953158.1 hypothetical protein [gamma proteobacterium symbiont of Bathyaustriella thionipta]MCU7957301.1 hypothetical protein [gamma proteobacterium symbiont of Bathyaustriella thionipta]MCU7966325.1 hypothetical protein [gamma proteobacterium symbiont of Bathyaustriella thionipta]